MGSQIIGPELAKMLVDAWLRSEFQHGRSATKVAKIMKIEEKNFTGGSTWTNPSNSHKLSELW